MKKFLIFLGTFSALICASFARTAFAVSDPPIFIKAINPGYTVDGIANVGEFIELAKSPDIGTPFSLAGFVLSYTNSSGNSVILYEFPDKSWITGESILLRLASSPDSELADLTYAKTLAFKAGPLLLTNGETIYDSVCWNGRDGCLPEFRSSNPTVLLRDAETGEFSHVAEYEPTFSSPKYYIEPDPEPEPEELVSIEPDLPEPAPSEPEVPEPEPEPIPPQCAGLKFSEILTYYESDPSEQFIEFVNTAKIPITMDSCQIKYKGKLYPLAGTVESGAYFVRELPDFRLTKNPVKSNTIELIDADGSVADSLTYPTGQKSGASYANVTVDDEQAFAVTYQATPGAANIYQEYRSCEEGKIINEATGKCVKVAATTTTKTCPEGSYLNTATNRCKKIVVNTGADYEIVASVAADDPSTNEKASFIAFSAVVAVAAAGFAFFVFEYRYEIKKLFCKACRRFRQKPRPAFGPH